MEIIEMRIEENLMEQKKMRTAAGRLLAAVLALAVALGILAGAPPSSYGDSGPAAAGVARGSAQTGGSQRIAVGADSSFAIAKNGAVYAWGANSNGQLGNGSMAGEAVPAAIAPSRFDGEVVSIAASAYRAVALTDNGSLYYWGIDPVGGSKRLAPTRIDGTNFDGDVVEARSLGTGFLARTSKGLVYAWGYNSSGLLGLGDWRVGSEVDAPTLVDFGGEPIEGIFAGDNTAFAVSAAGDVYGWGNNDYCQLGTATPSEAARAPRLIALPAGSGRAVSIAATQRSVFAVTEGGGVYAWGQDTFLAPYNPPQYRAPHSVAASNFGGRRIKSVSCGSYGRHGRCYAVTEGGEVYAWGTNDFGALGIGDNDPSVGEHSDSQWYYSIPILMPGALFGGKKIVSVSDNGLARHSIAIAADGSVYSWGDNYGTGALGTGETGVVTTSAPAVITREVAFHANGGSWNGGHDTVVSRLAFNTEVDAKELPDNPERSGYSCAGWNTEADGTGRAVDASMLVLEDMDAYAQWEVRKKDEAVDDKVVDQENKYAAPVSRFGATQKTVYVKRGKTVRLPYIAYAAAPGRQPITWKASNKKIATVRKGKAGGKLLVNGNTGARLTIKAGRKLGTGRITLTAANGKRLVIKVKVVKTLKKVARGSVKIGKLGKKAAKRLKAGQTKSLKAKFTKKATAIATWKSSNPKVARIDAAGKLTAIKKGKAKITLKVGGKKIAIKITVR
jgi:alpha-tubulin suppressor-like RCC1 family protein